MTIDEERRLICNGCIHSFVVDKDNFMFVFCDISLLFCYSIHLPEYELVEEGDICEGNWFQRRPIWVIH